MRFLRMASLGLALLSVAVDARARAIQEPPVAELAAKAEVIVDGEVVAVKWTEVRSKVTRDPNVTLPVRLAEATVKRRETSKGEMADTFVYRFFAIDPDYKQPILNGPMLTDVQPGQAYRFYLKKEGDSYVNVLHGDFDDWFAAPPLEFAKKRARAVLSR